MTDIKYQRMLLKLSGEALMGDDDFGINPGIIQRLAQEIAELQNAGIQLGVVIGGGNIFRGAGLAEGGLDRVRGDQMGMLATVMNALAMQDALQKTGVVAKVYSAISMPTVCDIYNPHQARQQVQQGAVCLFAAGTGNPFFTTDSAASLRAIEIQADVLVKATKVNGVYSADPMKDANAEFYPELTYDKALHEKLAVMDTAAIVLCRDNKLPLRVMNINEPGAMLALAKGEAIGSLLHSGD